jgi:molecular chaperone DnaJ
MPTTAKRAERRDYYEVLGVARDATGAAIRDAFRTLALKYHPDRNKEPGAEERFKEIAEAYAVLSDPRKRAEYDAGGFPGVSPEDLFAGVDFESIFRDAGFGLGEDLFERFFGRRGGGPRRGADVRVDAAVPLERIARGGEETVRYGRMADCGECKGSGASAGTQPRACDACGGSGQKVSERHERGVHVREVSTCARCGGRGRVVDHPCASCGGSGRMLREESLVVKVPAGAEDGLTLRIPGKGEAPEEAGGVPGDLHIVVHAAPDSRFERDGADLWRVQELDATDAVLGAEIMVPTLNGAIAVKVPAGSQPGARLRLRGKGLPRFGARGHGDLYVQLAIRLPERLSSEERGLWERLRAARGSSRPATSAAGA